MNKLKLLIAKYITPRLIIIIVVLALALWMFLRRQSLQEEIVVDAEDVTYIPTMTTFDANIIHTDSGMPRYHATAPVYYSFDNAPEPFWRFDQGAFIEQLDDNGDVSATLTCDSAVYDQRKQLWNCMGNVRVKSLAGDKFLTNQMFYDVREQKIYSDSFIHIEKSDRIIEGYGFVSNSQITEYTLNNPTMILPVSDFNRPESPSPSDSTSTNPSVNSATQSGVPSPPTSVTPPAPPAPQRLQPRSMESDRSAKPNRALSVKPVEVDASRVKSSPKTR